MPTTKLYTTSFGVTLNARESRRMRKMLKSLEESKQRMSGVMEPLLAALGEHLTDFTAKHTALASGHVRPKKPHTKKFEEYWSVTLIVKNNQVTGEIMVGSPIVATGVTYFSLSDPDCFPLIAEKIRTEYTALGKKKPKRRKKAAKE